MKTCSKCNLQKPFYKYSKRAKSFDGLQNFCKECRSKIYLVSKKEIKNKIISIHSRQVRSSKKRGHNPPTYSKEEFLEYCLNSESFNLIFKNWFESGFKKNLAPSIDRLDNSKGYSFDNIQVMTWKENKEKGYEERRVGKNGVCKSVVQHCKKTNVKLGEFVSIKSASISTGINRSTINRSLKNMVEPRKYIWTYG